MSLSDRLLETLNSLFISFLDSNRYTRKIIQRLGEPYLAGHNLLEGIQAIARNYEKRHRYSTFDILSEEAHSAEEALMTVRTYQQAIELLPESFRYDHAGNHPHSRPVSISVKPSSICLVTERNPVLRIEERPSLSRNLERIVKAAYEGRMDVTLDMEDHCWTDKSLEVAQELWRKGAENLGIVLQSRLNRTEQDIQERILDCEYPFPREKLRVRMCIGVYNEPNEIATRKKYEMKVRLVKEVALLLRAGMYVEIATHDWRVIDYLRDNVIAHFQIPPDRYEFQFLKGVHLGEKMGGYLQELGYVVRDYMPVELSEGEGTTYMFRRLKSNPGLMWNGLKNVLQGIGKTKS